jgi:hypothetical protein
VCSLDPKQLACNVRKWRNLVLEELDEVYPDSPYNLLLVGRWEGDHGQRFRAVLLGPSSGDPGSYQRRARGCETPVCQAGYAFDAGLLDVQFRGRLGFVVAIG